MYYFPREKSNTNVQILGSIIGKMYLDAEKTLTRAICFFFIKDVCSDNVYVSVKMLKNGESQNFA